MFFDRFERAVRESEEEPILFILPPLNRKIAQKLVHSDPVVEIRLGSEAIRDEDRIRLERVDRLVPAIITKVLVVGVDRVLASWKEHGPGEIGLASLVSVSAGVARAVQALG